MTNANDKIKSSLIEDNRTGTDVGIGTEFGRVIAAKYTTLAPSLQDGKFSFLRLDSAGRLKCILDGATFNISGNDFEVDVSSFRGINNSLDRKDGWVLADGQDISGTTPDWQLIGGKDRVNDVFRALSINSNGEIVVSTGTSAGIYEEDSAHATGDKGAHVLSVRTDNATSLVSGDGDYASLLTNDHGELWTASGTRSGIHAEDAAHTSGDAGKFVLAVRNDNQTSLASADGDYTPFSVDTNGRLWTISGTTSGIYTDQAPFTVGTDKFAAVGGIYELTESTLSTGSTGVIALTAARHVKSRIDGFDVATDSNKVFDVSPLSQEFVNENLNIGPLSHGTTYSYIDMDGYRNVSVQIEVTGTALRTFLQATNEPTTALTSCAYQDVTNALTGTTVFTSSSFFFINEDTTPRAFRLRNSSFGTTASYTVHIKKFY